MQNCANFKMHFFACFFLTEKLKRCNKKYIDIKIVTMLLDIGEDFGE